MVDTPLRLKCDGFKKKYQNKLNRTIGLKTLNISERCQNENNFQKSLKKYSMNFVGL